MYIMLNEMFNAHQLFMLLSCDSANCEDREKNGMTRKCGEIQVSQMVMTVHLVNISRSVESQSISQFLGF